MVSSVTAFEYSGNRWEGNSVNFVSEMYFPSDWFEEVEKAGDTWSNAGADFEFESGGISTSNYITWGEVEEDVIAVAKTWADDDGYITMAEMKFNSDDYEFSTSGESDKYDVQNVAAHEFGHWLRLLHSDEPDATMYHSTYKGETSKRTLHDVDKEGIKYIYGEH